MANFEDFHEKWMEMQEDTRRRWLEAYMKQYCGTLKKHGSPVQKKRKGKRRLRVINGMVPAEDAFWMYATIGYPMEFLVEKMEERGFKVDVKGFERLLEQERLRSRARSKFVA